MYNAPTRRRVRMHTYFSTHAQQQQQQHHHYNIGYRTTCTYIIQHERCIVSNYTRFEIGLARHEGQILAVTAAAAAEQSKRTHKKLAARAYVRRPGCCNITRPSRSRVVVDAAARRIQGQPVNSGCGGGGDGVQVKELLTLNACTTYIATQCRRRRRRRRSFFQNTKPRE